MLNKTDVLNTIVKNMRLVVEDFDDSRFDPALSMHAHGANSLEMVEIVSRTMRELNVKVPRTRLNRVENIDQLADEVLLACNRVPG